MRRDSSDKRSDVEFRHIGPAPKGPFRTKRVAWGGPAASSNRSTVGTCYAFRASPSGSNPPQAMPGRVAVRIAG